MPDASFEYGNWFKTKQELVPGQGVQMMAQDLYFFQKAREMGYKFACDARVKVDHYDAQNQLMW